MSVDPNIDYGSHDPDDNTELPDDPRIRKAQETEARIRAVLATKENPLSDSEGTAARMRKSSRQFSEKTAEDADDTE